MRSPCRTHASLAPAPPLTTPPPPPSPQLLVLKYVQNKDVFMRYHKAHLTRRLILDISADSEIEENMVEWLRVRPLGRDGGASGRGGQPLTLLPVPSQEVGMPADYVNKLARMFQDIKVSEDLNQSFKEMHKHNKLALPGEESGVPAAVSLAAAWKPLIHQSQRRFQAAAASAEGSPIQVPRSSSGTWMVLLPLPCL